MDKQKFYEKMIEVRGKYFEKTLDEMQTDYVKDYDKLFKSLLFDINNRMKEYADDRGNIRAVYLSKIRTDVKEEIIKFGKDYQGLSKKLLKDASRRSFDDFINLYDEMGLSKLASNVRFDKNIMDYLISYKNLDGLTISERIWGKDDNIGHMGEIRKTIMNTLTGNILRGEEVWDTMMELEDKKKPNVEIPEYLQKQFEKMSQDEIFDAVNLYTIKKGHYLTNRLVETEIERAYRNTNLKILKEQEWVLGVKWNLSSRHTGKQPCDCEKNSKANLFGMGEGVYPIDKYPVAPAHLYCMCYETEIIDLDYAAQNTQKSSIIDNKDDKKEISDNIKKQVSSEYAEKINGYIKKSPEDIQKLWNKIEKDIKIEDYKSKSAYYSPSKQSINFNLDSDSNNDNGFGENTQFFHEIGHFIDNKIYADKNDLKLSLIFQSEMYNDGIFGKTLEAEAQEAVTKAWDKLKELNPGMKIQKQQAYQSIKNEIEKLSTQSRADICDIFEGATKGKIQPNIGHGTSYWKEHQVASEAFAEMFSATTANPESLEQIKKYFPKSYNIFLEIIKEMIK